MRILILIFTAVSLFVSPSLGADSNGFDAFIKSREVVATLYFNANAEELSKAEQGRLIATIQQLRQAQKNGRMIRVEGYSSKEGNQEKNFILSFFRARAVADIIESNGLPSEVSLTGFGDLRADSNDHAKERRVEIASYIKPGGIKKVKVANKKQTSDPTLNRSANLSTDEQEIDSYRVDQAIRRKIDDRNRGIADKYELRDEVAPGLSQKIDFSTEDLDHSYSQWRKAVAPGNSQKLSRAKNIADDDLKRGYSKLQKSRGGEGSPGVTMVEPVQAPVIDALMIEQAIMEKIGVAPATPSGSVTQVSLDYQQ